MKTEDWRRGTGDSATAPARGVRLFAGFTAALTLVLILAGGFVTTTATGDTIPTWPHWWGRLDGGAWVEWTHRVVASTLGLCVLALAIWLRRVEPRAWVRRLGWIAFAAVVAQGMLGGMRVLFVIPRPVAAIAHATFAQAIFCTVVGIALFLSRGWREARGDEETYGARSLALTTAVLAFLQLVAGAVTRHTGAGITVHLVGAGLVFLFGSLLGSRLMTTALQRGGLLLLTLLLVQVALGLTAWSVSRNDFVRSVEAPLWQVVSITAHVAVGALVLATSLVLALRCFRSAPVPVKPARAEKERAPAPGGVEGPAPSGVEGPAPGGVEGPAPSSAEVPAPSSAEVKA